MQKYDKTNWVANKTLVTAENLNKIEKQIELLTQDAIYQKEVNVTVSNTLDNKVDLQIFNDTKNNFNEQLDKKASKEDVAKISSGTPLFADSIEKMTDITKNYVNTTDGYLYIYSNSSFINSGVKYQETGLSDGQVTRRALSNSLCGRDFEVKQTKAYPGFSFVVNNAPKGRNITLSCKLLAKQPITSWIQMQYSYGGSYESRHLAPPETDVQQEYTTTWENTTDRTVTAFNIVLDNNNPTTSIDGLFTDVRLFIDGTEHCDFEMTADITGVTDLTDYNYTLASRNFVQNSIKNLDTLCTVAKLDTSIFGKKYEISGFKGSTPRLQLIKFKKHYKNATIQFSFKVTPKNHITHFNVITNGWQSSGYYTSNIRPNATTLIEGSMSESYEFDGLGFFISDNNPSSSLDGLYEDLIIKINGEVVDFDLTTESADNVPNREIVDVTEEQQLIASKKFVEDSINEAMNGGDKREFVLPFVNNLYVVQGSKRKHSVPIFIDYLYDGNRDKILFANGEDRAYIREATLSPDSQSSNIVNTKETLKFKSETLNVPDVTFNKLSIEENTPNGIIRLLIIGDSVSAGAITEKQYWAIARELFALEDIDRKRDSNVMFLGSNNVRKETISYGGVTKEIKSCACGISSWSLNHWLTNSASHFVYDNNGTPTFSILKWLERYRTHADDGTKLELGDSRLGTEINESNIDNIQCCTPNIVYINSTHNGGSIEEHEKMIEIIRREIPNCKIIVGNPMPLIGTWHKEKYVGKDWLDDESYITGPNYNWGGAYGTSRIESLNYYMEKERNNDWFHFMPQVVTMPTVEALEYELVDCGVKQMKQVTKVNQLPREHPGTITHKIWGYELYALLKYIVAIGQGSTNNFDKVPLF